MKRFLPSVDFSSNRCNKFEFCFLRSKWRGKERKGGVHQILWWSINTVLFINSQEKGKKKNGNRNLKGLVYNQFADILCDSSVSLFSFIQCIPCVCVYIYVHNAWRMYLKSREQIQPSKKERKWRYVGIWQEEVVGSVVPCYPQS